MNDVRWTRGGCRKGGATFNDVIRVIGVTRPSPFVLFSALLLPCIILNANRRTKTGEAWE